MSDAADPDPSDLADLDAADPAAAAAPDRLGEGNGPAAPDERAPSRAHALLAATDNQRSPNGYPTLAAMETHALRRGQQPLYVRTVLLFGALLLVFSMVLATAARHLEPGAVPSAALSWARAKIEHVDAATVATVGREAADAERAPSARNGARSTGRTRATSGGIDARGVNSQTGTSGAKGQSGQRAPKATPPPKPPPPPLRPPPPSQPPPQPQRPPTQPQRPPTQPQQPQARASEGTAKAQQPTAAESGRPAASPREASARDGAGSTSPSTGNGFMEAFPRRRLLRTARVLLSHMRTWYSWSL